MVRRRVAWMAVLLMAAAAGHAAAAEICRRTPGQPLPADIPARIAAVACDENALWFAPFIDLDGHLASTQVSEAESALLDDGVTPAWRRVADYWKGSGLLWSMEGFPGAADCGGTSMERAVTASCRAFLVDMPWSAVFVSFVMSRAGLPQFRASARHADFVRDAHRVSSPFRLADPDLEPPAAGDLLCFARMPAATFGHAGLKAWLDRPFSGALNMHCDIVVSVDGGHAYLVGGNVLQGVTMRMLAVNRQGRLWSLPRRSGVATDCRPDNAAACSFNRQDWVALLKLMPIAAPAPPVPSPCCDACPLPMPAGMQRCEAPPTSAPVP